MKGSDMLETERYLDQAIRLALDNVAAGGRPFGAVVVRDERVLATGVNEILRTHDPTAHAEMSALRAASQALKSPDLSGCTVYASGHPCPMCLAAMRMSGVRSVFFAYSNEEAEPYGLSTAAVYADLALPLAEQSMAIRHVARRGPPDLYEAWRRRNGEADSA